MPFISVTEMFVVGTDCHISVKVHFILCRNAQKYMEELPIADQIDFIRKRLELHKFDLTSSAYSFCPFLQQQSAAQAREEAAPSRRCR